MAERLTARERLDQMRELAKEQRVTTQKSLRVATADANREARKEHAEHLKALGKLLDETGLSAYAVETLRPWLVLAKLLDETGFSAYGAETLRPWLKDLAVRMEQDRQGELTNGIP